MVCELILTRILRKGEGEGDRHEVIFQVIGAFQVKMSESVRETTSVDNIYGDTLTDLMSSSFIYGTHSQLSCLIIYHIKIFSCSVLVLRDMSKQKRSLLSGPENS